MKRFLALLTEKNGLPRWLQAHPAPDRGKSAVFSPSNHILELEREAAKLEGERGELQSEIAATETAIAEKELETYTVAAGDDGGGVYSHR